MLFACRRYPVASVEAAVKKALRQHELSPWWISYYLGGEARDKTAPKRTGHAGPQSRPGAVRDYMTLLTEQEEVGRE